MNFASQPLVIGVDPGATTGIAVVRVDTGDGVLLQATPDAVAHVLRSFSFGHILEVALERYVIGRRSSRTSTSSAGRVTRDLIGMVQGMSAELDAPVVQRAAGLVKPWATDKRLDAAGFALRGMPHARDAARHALYACCSDFGTPDPLSTRAPATTPQARTTRSPR